MAGDFAPWVESQLARMFFKGESSYISAGNRISGGGSGSTGGSGTSGSGESNNPLSISEVELNNSVAKAQLLPLSAAKRTKC